MKEARGHFWGSQRQISARVTKWSAMTMARVFFSARVSHSVTRCLPRTVCSQNKSDTSKTDRVLIVLCVLIVFRTNSQVKFLVARLTGII